MSQRPSDEATLRPWSASLRPSKARRTTVLALLTVGLGAGLGAGCGTRTARDRAWLDDALSARLGAPTHAESTRTLPPGVVIEDGLDAAELTAIVLWRNPALRAERFRIDAAHATLDEAGRLANPQLSLAAPFGALNAAATLFAPLESLWQMPARTAAAARAADLAAVSVLVAALDQVLAARLLLVELGLAEDRVRLQASLAATAAERARVAEVRARLGEISRRDERLFAAEAQLAADAVQQAEAERAMAEARLVAALDLPATQRLTPYFAPEIEGLPAEGELTRLARALRPDVQAAELAVAAAHAQVDWAGAQVMAVGALVEAQWGQNSAPGMRVGLRAELPIFGVNPGGRGRAAAELGRSLAALSQVAQATVLEVRVGHTRAQQAARSRVRYEAEVLPALEAALTVSTDAVDSGDADPLAVLEVLRRLAEARLRQADLVAEQRRALCALERALGARLSRAAAAVHGTEVEPKGTQVEPEEAQSP